MSAENLTRDEARARAEVIRHVAYEISLDLTHQGETFRSSTRVAFQADTGASTFIDLIAPSVETVTLNGTELDRDQVFDGTRITLDDLTEHNELLVIAHPRYMNTGEGLHRFVDPVDSQTYLYSQFEVADTRRVFAVFEQPDIKATFQFTVTAPSHWQVISNSPTPEPQPLGNDSSRWTFKPTDVLPCYVTAIIAGPYTRVTGSLTSSDGREIPLAVLCRQSLAPHLDAENIFEITRAGFEFFERQFNRPYPFTKYDQIFVPEFNAGAMENAGAVTFLENYVFRSQVPEATVERRAVTILHELAHMWFGDLVTMRWWNDLWLNESFAEYASTWATSEATRWTDAWTTFASLEKSWAYRQDQLVSTHPIVARINDLEDVEVNFDGITYAKGASVLKQLVAWVGQEDFITGVRRYFDKHAHGNTELNDLLVELEHTSGRDLREWSNLWLEKAGVNTLSAEIEVDSEGIIQRYDLLQSAPADHPTLRPHRLVVSGYRLNADTSRLERDERFELDVDGERTGVPGLIGQVRPDVILINDEDLAYAKVRLDKVSLANAVGNLHAFDDSLARTLVWSIIWDMTRDGEWAPSRYIDVLLTNIGVETDSTALMVLLRQLKTAVDSYIDPLNTEQVSALVADELLSLAVSAPGGTDAQLQLLKAFITQASTDEHLEVLRDLYHERRSLPGRPIDTDLQWDLTIALAAHGDSTIVTTQLERDNTASGAIFAQTARSAIPAQEAKDEVWQQVVREGNLPNAHQGAAIAGFNRTKDRSLLTKYATEYFEVLPAIWAERTSEMATGIVVGLYPFKLADIDDSHGIDVLEMTDQFLDALGDRSPALARLVRENRDVAARALAAQRADRQLN